MPVIENEVPSDGELHDYLTEWLGGLTGISMLATYPVSGSSYQPTVAEAMEYLWTHPLRPSFLDRSFSTLLEALKRLNALRRDDGFWQNTNSRPTVFKLKEHFDRILREAPDEVLSLLARVFLDIAYVGEFHPDRWAHLYRLGAVDVGFVTFCAMLLEIAGAPDTDEFAAFAHATSSVPEVVEVLREVEANGGTLWAEWVRRVLAAIDAGPGKTRP